VALLLLLYRKSLIDFLTVVGQRATEINIGSWASLKLPVLSETPLDQDVVDFQKLDGAALSGSQKSELFRQFRSAGKNEYTVINLGEGAEWISSRLFIFAIMLQRMKSLKHVVFLFQNNAAEIVYLGTASVDSVHWTLAARQPWLETAFAKAYGDSAPSPPSVTPYSWTTNDRGALTAAVAESIVRSYLQKLAGPMPAPGAPDWVQLANSPEHATWLNADDIVQILGTNLWRDAVRYREERKDLLKSILECSSPCVAITAESGAFESLVDRQQLLTKVGHRLSSNIAR
jgi:hypothetical protein